jgi:hypothetical protein
VRYAATGVFRSGGFTHGVIPGIAFLVSVLAVSFSLTAGLVHLVISKRFHAPLDAKLFRADRLYWLCLPVAAILCTVLIAFE